MKPSLLAIVFLTGTVHSRTIWGVFSALFGYEEDPEENSILFDDENHRDSSRKQESSADRGAGGKESNEILLEDVDPYTQKKIEKKIDNRVGWIFPIKYDQRTEEGYRKAMEQVAEYLKNLSNQDNGLGQGAGPAYTQLDLRFGAYDDYGVFRWDDDDPYDDGDGGGLDDGDYGGNDFDYDDYDFGFGGHDELK